MQSYRRDLMSGAAFVALALVSPVLLGQAIANPAGGTVTTGSATISAPSSKTTTVDQKSEDVVIDWSSFNIGNGQTTQFVQPNSSAIAVNRIGGASASQVLGTLDANGRVVLINGNGLLFGGNAHVNVGSLIATSTDGSDSDLLAGKFTKAGNQNASIVNRGTINAANGGTVALVAPSVTNAGTVQAKLGTVALGAANAFTVDFKGDGLVSFAAQGDVNGKATATNTGRLSGATVTMTARAAEGLATGVVNVGGLIQAQTAQQVGGTIVLDAGDGGSINLQKATLDASGPQGGGSITIGGWNQASIVADNGSVVEASAGTTGNGGHISAIASINQFGAQVYAQGGPRSGNGGSVETSGDVVGLAGARVDTLAAFGKTGTWLIDPYTVTISNDPSTGGYTFTSTSADSNINVDDLVAALATTNVTIAAHGDATGNARGNGPCGFCAGSFSGSGSGGSLGGHNTSDITVLVPLSWSAPTVLSLGASDTISIDAPITIGGGGLVLGDPSDSTLAPQSIEINANIAFTGAASGPSSVFTLNPNNAQMYGYALNDGATVTFADTRYAFAVNGTTFTLIDNANELLRDLNEDPNGYFALANDIDLAGKTYTESPIVEFAGAFEGFNNTIGGLTINDNRDEGVGLFGEIDGTVQDLGVTNADVVSTSGGGAAIGALAGVVDGTVNNAYATGTVTGGNGAAVGGLVGANIGEISLSTSSATVYGGFESAVGGLVGFNEGVIFQSSAAGAVSDNFVTELGGLVGENVGEIYQSFADGTVSGSSGDIDTGIGGLVGVNEGLVEASYATGTVMGGAGNEIGGLVGMNENEIDGSYATGAVTGGPGSAVGGLVGVNEFEIDESYATGAVQVDGTYAAAGGLVGYNPGDISQSFATGAVTGSHSDDLGGLVGSNDGVINQTYAMGAVKGGGGETAAGGLVGYNGSTIEESYSVGTVKAGPGAEVGGFVGVDDGGITTSYWDMQTSGITNPEQGAGNVSGDAGITGATTATLQSALDPNWDPSVWGLVAGVSYPYLQWQSPDGTPQVVSGIVGNGANLVSGAGVGLLVDGTTADPLVSMNSGADGYYYLLLAPGTISGSGSQVLAYVASGAPPEANSYYQDATDSLSDLDLQERTLEITTDQATASGMIAGLDTAIGSQTGSQFLYTAAGGFSSGINVAIEDSAAALDIDTALDFTGDHVTLDAAGTIGESTGAIDAYALTLGSVGDILLTGANDIAVLNGANTGGSGNLDVNDTGPLRIAGTLNAGTGAVTLNSTGKIAETSVGSIIAASLTGSSVGGAVFTGDNTIGTLDAFTNTGANSISLTDGEALTVSGAVTTGTGNIVLTTTSGGIDIVDQLTAGNRVYLDSAGTISETGGISASLLAGSSVGGATLNGTNLITHLGAFSNTGLGGLTLVDGTHLVVEGPVSGDLGDVDITLTTGAIRLTGDVSGADVTLISDTNLVDQISGSITTAGALDVTAYRDITMDGENTYGSEDLVSEHGTTTGE
jgi:filamentous hemagglutinin family protein